MSFLCKFFPIKKSKEFESVTLTGYSPQNDSQTTTLSSLFIDPEINPTT